MEQERGAMTLLEYLYDQLDMLATVDLKDEARVDAACKVSKAVNDTAGTIMGMVELSVRAVGAVPTMGNREMVAGFFSEGKR